MLRSQLAAAQTWHLGDWNAFWENCFLDYRLHFLFKEDVHGIKEKVKQPLFRKLADSAHALLAAASSHFPPAPPSIAAVANIYIWSRTQQCSAGEGRFQVGHGTWIQWEVSAGHNIVTQVLILQSYFERGI